MRRSASQARLLDGAVRRGWITPGVAGAVRVAAVPVLVVAVLTWLVVTVLRAGGAGDPSPYAEFVDRSNGSQFGVQLNTAFESFGAFSAVVPGQGRVWPKDRVRTTRGVDGAVELRYEGAGLRDPQVQPGVVDERRGTPPPPEPVQVRLVGRVQAATHTASIDLWVDGTRYRIVSTGPPGSADEVVGEFLDAVRTGNWAALYEIEGSSMRNGNRRSTFVTEMTNAGVVTSVSGARAVGPTTYSTGTGAVLARTPIRLTYDAGTGDPQVDATLVVAVEAGAWRVLAVE